jgi:hypothetical protein
MADLEISGLTDGGAAQDGDLVHAVRGVNSRKVEMGDAAGKNVGTGSGQVAAGDHTHAHFSDTGNPHSVTKTQIGLGNVTNDAQIPLSYLDTDTALTANSDTKVATQKAAKAYSDTKIPLSYIDTDTSLAANSDSKIASQKAIKAYVDGLLAANDAMVLKGVVDCSSNPNYPAASAGHAYRVSVAGKIGGASGPNVEAGDYLLCLSDGTSAGDHATVGSSWGIIQVNIDGAVVAASNFGTDNRLLRSDGTGRGVQASGITVDDSNNMSGVLSATLGGSSAQFPTAITVNPSTHATSRRAAVALDNWSWNQDTAGNGTKDFGLYSAVLGVSVFTFNTAGAATFAYAVSLGISNAFTCGSVELGHATQNTLTAASGVLSIEGKQLLMSGKHTIAMPAGAWKAKASGGATAVTYQDVPGFSFNGTSATRVRFIIPMPKGWDEGTISFKVYGVVDTGGSSGNVAVWKLAAKAFSHDDAIWTTTDLSTGAQAANMSWTANDDLLISAESSALTIDGTPAEGDLVLFELWRDPADASDNNTADFIALAVHIYYSINAATDA